MLHSVLALLGTWRNVHMVTATHLHDELEEKSLLSN